MKEKQKRYLQRRDFILPVVIFLLVSGILCGLFGMIERDSVFENRTRCQYIAANQAGIMRDSIDSALSRAYTMKALIISHDGDIDFFDTQAADIYEEANLESGIVLKNIAAAPDGKVAKVYPLTGNESLIDFNFMDASQPGNQEAIDAYERGELVVTAPFSLVQGGMGMAGRLPVFLGDDKEADFWGLVTVTMDFDKLLEAFRLSSLEDMGLYYELWYTNDDGEKVSLDASAHTPANPVSCEFALNNLDWHLDVAPKAGWLDYAGLFMEIAIILAIALLVALLMLDKSKLRRANETLEQLANLDGLTLCFSRHYVNMVLINQRTGQWNDPNARYSLAILDIDYFKSINDTYGHEVGDRAIVAVAQVLTDATKQANGDCVIRFGGDEFIILFNDVTIERFTKKLGSIVKEVQAIRFADHPNLRLTVSVGGEFFVSPEQSHYYEMVENADKKLYQAKENGRNQFCI